MRSVCVKSGQSALLALTLIVVVADSVPAAGVPAVGNNRDPVVVAHQHRYPLMLILGPNGESRGQ